MPEDGNEAWRKRVPWWTDKAIAAIGRLLRPQYNVFEWGTGGSTIWFARQVATVVSIENGEGWYRRVKATLAEEGIKNAELKFLRGSDYTQAIRIYADQLFDVVVVDGRMRVACIEEALPKVRSGGLLVVDDSQRLRYQAGLALLADWPRVDFPVERRQTTYFRRPRDG